METKNSTEDAAGVIEAIRMKTGETFEVKCDKADLPMLGQYKWLVAPKCLSVFRRIQKSGQSTTESLHRLLLNEKFINFRNKNKLDFRRENIFGSEKGTRDRKSGVKLKGNPFIVVPGAGVTVYTTDRDGKTNGHFFVDEDDLEFVAKYTWNIDGRGYVRTKLNKKINGRKSLSLHRTVMGAGAKDEVDHINRVRHDNRKANLRLCTASENHHNTGLYRDNPTGITGVTRDKRWWRAMIQINGKILRKGFPNPAGLS